MAGGYFGVCVGMGGYLGVGIVGWLWLVGCVSEWMKVIGKKVLVKLKTT